MNQDSPFASVFESFVATAERFADNEFLHVPKEAAERYAPAAIGFRYGEALHAVGTIRDAYASAGYGRGHRVALAFDNRVEFFLHFLALNALGASIVPLNAEMPDSDILFVVRHSDAVCVTCLPEHLDKLQASLASLDVAIHANTEPPPPPRRQAQPAAADDVALKLREAALLYTSGTTGQPKGCILANEYFLGVGLLYVGLGGYCAFREGTDRLLTPLPVTHMNALACSFMAMVLTGGCLIQLDRFHPSSWWKTVGDSGATCLHYLGVMPAMLLNAPEAATDNVGDRVRFGFGAGSDPRHQERFERRFGFPLIEAWAMTETGGGAWISAAEEPRHVGHRCFGKAPPGLAWRLVDEAGHDVPDGVAGELLVRRAEGDRRRFFFSGYYKAPEATDEAWEGGWFHTGDVVRVDAAGSFFFVDRRKNVVRRSGENIAAVEVESILQQHPAVHACAVAPAPDEVRGEEVFAFVVPVDGEAAGAGLAEELAAWCLERLTYFKAPGYVAFASVLPQTASQKLARGEIKKLMLARLEEGDCFDLRAGKKRPRSAAHA